MEPLRGTLFFKRMARPWNLCGPWTPGGKLHKSRNVTLGVAAQPSLWSRRDPDKEE